MQVRFFPLASRQAFCPADAQTHFPASLQVMPALQVPPSVPVQTPPHPSACPHEKPDPLQVGTQPAQRCAAGSQVVPFATQSTQLSPPPPHWLGRLPGAHFEL